MKHRTNSETSAEQGLAQIGVENSINDLSFLFEEAQLHGSTPGRYLANATDDAIRNFRLRVQELGEYNIK